MKTYLVITKTGYMNLEADNLSDAVNKTLQIVKKESDIISITVLKTL